MFGNLFGNRIVEVSQTIKDETSKLSPAAMLKLNSIRRFVEYGKGNVGSFNTISKKTYGAYTEKVREENEHDIRVHYIVSMEMELHLMNKSVTTKLKEWLERNKPGAALGMAGTLFEGYVNNKDAIDAAIQHAHDLLHRIPICSDDTSGNSDVTWHDVTLQEVFKDPVYKDQYAYFSYLKELFQAPESFERPETGG
jgi:hypothetical protein